MNVFCAYLDDYVMDNKLLGDKYLSLNNYLNKNQKVYPLIYAVLLNVQGKIYKSFDLNLLCDQMFYELQEVIK